jgi:thiol-disulfide isomerase/thioredoxin
MTLYPHQTSTTPRKATTPGKAARYFAFLLAAVAAFAVPGNSALAQEACVTKPERQTALKEAAFGEVAAFAVGEDAKSLGELTFLAPDNSTRTLSSFKGKVILVNLWATWCAPCRKEMPALDALQKQKGNDKFEVVAVNVDTRNPERATEFLDEIGVSTLTRYHDPKGHILQDLKKKGRAPGLPSTVLFDENGCELGFLLGPAEWASEDALKLIDAALK